ncbi:hypothetical protein EV183_001082 [Coemansia sp. RSA 2336]|nr:hypothetical protein EV183_001082 [Coemansia sp. RSA 2336]
MIYAEDGNALSWAQERQRPLDPMYSLYEFLSTMPLYAKKELFQSMNRVLDNHVISDVFTTSSQMRWAVGVIRLGLQLPLEDLDIINSAFKQYSDVIFTLHRLRFNDNLMDENITTEMLSEYAALEVLKRPSVLFNPRLFFENDLPDQTVRNMGGQIHYKTAESFVFHGKKGSKEGQASEGDPGKQGTSTSYPNSPTQESHPYINDKYNATRRLRGVSSAVAIGNHSNQQQQQQQEQQQRSGDDHSSEDSQRQTLRGAARTHQALELWDRYVGFLTHVLRVYSTMMRGLQPLVSEQVTNEIFRSIISVIDMILSQGGTNPRLKEWTARYRDVIGEDIWDRTWATIGNRLETPAIKLLLDVWGRIISKHRVACSQLVTNVRYWLHRDRFVEVWMLLIDQISQRVLRMHYPHDTSIGVDKIYVRFADFSMTTTTTDEDAVFILTAFARTKVDFELIKNRGYYMYALEVCTIIERILAIKKVLLIDGKQYVQYPPTANYILHYFGDALFSMARRQYIPSREFIIAKQRVMTVLTRMLTLEECPHDKILPQNCMRILQTFHQAVAQNREAQATLPNIPALLKNTPLVRPLIPRLFDLVCHVLPKERYATLILDERVTRHYAYEALSALIAFVGYYHSLSQSDLIADLDRLLRKHLDNQIKDVVGCAQLGYLRNSCESLIRRIERCRFKKSAEKDPTFKRYLRFIFQTLTLSVVTENDTENMQYLTCIILTFLYQYSRYCSGYVETFINFYIEQLKSTKSDMLSTVYTYGLTQAAMITWTSSLSRNQIQRITTAIIDMLANCDNNLHRYTCWNPYHQLFISSLRCLISWVSILSDSKLLAPVSLNKLVDLLTRCNGFISQAQPKQNFDKPKSGFRLQLVTSNLEANTAEESADLLNKSSQSEGSLTDSNAETITSFTMHDLFGKSAKIALPEIGLNKPAEKIYTLSNTLYTTLNTTIAVFSTTILRGMDTMQYYAKHIPTDVYTTRQAIHHRSLPKTKSILKYFCPQVADLLEGYVPTSIRFFSVFHRAIYTVINLKKYSNGKWSDSVLFTTSRYAGGSKQWLTFLKHPKASKVQRTDCDLECSSDTTPLPWIRLGNDVMYPESVKKKLRFSDALENLRGAKSQVDDASEQAIEQATATDYKRLHENRNAPDVQFAPAQPSEQPLRGNTYDRPTCALFFGIDFSLLRIIEPILSDLDQLDDLDRPFSAHAGIIYLQSPDSLSTQRDICKGPLRGTSVEFSRFLSLLNRLHLSPAELLKRRSSLPLLRYVFAIKGFKVCYNLAPNISSLISGEPMSPEDNVEFYQLLRQRGIAVLWFDSHPGSLNTDLAWQFIDRLRSYTEKPRRKFSDDEYLQPSNPNAEKQSSGLDSPPATGPPPPSDQASRPSSADPSSSVTGSLLDYRYTASHSNVKQTAKKTLVAKMFHIKRQAHLSPNNELYRCCSEPGITLSKWPPKRAVKPTTPESVRSARTGVSVSTKVQPPESEAGIHSKGKQPLGTRSMPKDTPLGPLEKFLKASTRQNSAAYQAQPGHNDISRQAPGVTEECSDSEPRVRILIALAPVVDTNGRLLKVAVSTTGGPDKLNRDFARMTGPLMSNMVVESKYIAQILSATILDASANMASLHNDDFSMVYKRMEMIKNIIDKYSIKHESISSAHKFMFPVGTSGVQSTFHIHQNT